MRLILPLLLLSSPLLFSFCNAAQCGVVLEIDTPTRAKRIVGGSLSSEGTWPWQVSLQVRNSTDGSLRWAGCGGTLIGDRWVLTAAHCFLVPITEPISKNYSVLIGSTFASIRNESELVRTVKRVIRHPDYGMHGSVHDGEDIALLELESSPSNESWIVPLCLPSRNQSIPLDIKAVAIGYGSSFAPEDFHGPVSPPDKQLREVTLTVHELEYCDWGNSTLPEIYHHNRRLGRGFGYGLCVGDKAHSPLHGDSGGPLMMQAANGRWFQIGISSGSVGKFVKAINISITTTAPPTISPPREEEGSGFESDNRDSVMEGSGFQPALEGSGEMMLANDTATETPQFEEKRIYERYKSIFTNVHKYCRWIEKKTEGEVNCPEEDVTFEAPQVLPSDE